MNKLVQQLDRIDPFSAASQNLIRELMAASKKPESKPTSKPTSKPASKPRPEFDNKAEIESATYNDQSAERALSAKYSSLQNFIDLTRPQVYLMLGMPKSGKTHLTKWLLHTYFNSGEVQENKPYWTIVFSGMKYNDDYKDMIPERALLDHKDESLEMYVNYLRNLKEKLRQDMPHSILVLDDVVGLFDSSNKVFQNLITIHRHLNLTVIISVQYLHGNVSPTFRACVTAGFIFHTMQEISLKALFSVFGQQFENRKAFIKHFMKATKEKHTCMLCLAHERNLERNCLSFKAPSKFPQKQLKFTQMQFDDKEDPKENEQQMTQTIANNAINPNYYLSKLSKQ